MKKLLMTDIFKLEEKSLEFLNRIIEFESYTQSESVRLLKFVLNYCNSLGFKTRIIDNIVGWAEVGTGDKLMLFPVHLDVVPEGIGWNSNPYKLAEDECFLYGRGVTDNKSSVSIFVHLLDYINKNENLENWRIRIVFGTREETDMSCIKRYLKTEDKPLTGFVPDGQYPGFCGEKGRIHVCLYFSEYMNFSINQITGGSKVNSVPDYAMYQLDKGGIQTFYGKAAHAFKPEKGENAIVKMLQKLTFVEEFNQLLNYISQFDKIASENSENVFGKDTINLGVIKKEGTDKIVCELDIRYGLNNTYEQILTDLIDSLDLWTINLLSHKDIHFVESINNLYLDTLLQVYQEYTRDIDSKFKTVGGGTYASFFQEFIAFGPSFPNCRSYSHSANEQMNKDNFRKNIEIYYSAIEELKEICDSED